MTPKQMKEVIQAHIDNQPIQFKQKNDSKWRDVAQPLWAFSIMDYRVKSKPQKFIVYGDTMSSLSVTAQAQTTDIRVLKKHWTYLFEVTEEIKN